VLYTRTWRKVRESNSHGLAAITGFRPDKHANATFRLICPMGQGGCLLSPSFCQLKKCLRLVSPANTGLLLPPFLGLASLGANCVSYRPQPVGCPCST
jgi:hypothetical protein